ncbi:hypothetical protein MMC25_000027 [Agyrium rufum]|nr:hypothetical protein [Agyrium rufum]
MSNNTKISDSRFAFTPKSFWPGNRRKEDEELVRQEKDLARLVEDCGDAEGHANRLPRGAHADDPAEALFAFECLHDMQYGGNGEESGEDYRGDETWAVVEVGAVDVGESCF